MFSRDVRNFGADCLMLKIHTRRKISTQSDILRFVILSSPESLSYIQVNYSACKLPMLDIIADNFTF